MIESILRATDCGDMPRVGREIFMQRLHLFNTQILMHDMIAAEYKGKDRRDLEKTYPRLWETCQNRFNCQLKRMALRYLTGVELMNRHDSNGPDGG